MGYNVVITAFAKVTGTKVDQWDSRTLGTGDDDWFKYDSKNNKGQLVLISFGGATQGPWEKVDLTDVKGLAKNTVDYCKVNGIHGGDFDLEGKAVGIRADDVREKYLKIRKLITAIRQEANKRIAEFPQGFFITAAPQTNGDSQRLYWAGAKAQKAFFDDMLKADACGGKPCFDAVLVQNYNAQAMTPKKAYAMTKELLVCNQDTRIVMGYDLEPTEWDRNFPLTDRTAGGKDAPIVAATDFAQEHEVNGAFVWQADLDAIGAASNKGLESSGNEYSWAKALAKYYGSKAGKHE
jgi:chitinase